MSEIPGLPSSEHVSQPPSPHSRLPVLEIAGLSFVAIALLFTATNPIQRLNVPFGLMVTSLLLFGAGGLIFPQIFNLRALPFTGLNRLPWRPTLLAFLIGATNMLVAGFLMGAARELLPPGWSEMADQTTQLLSRADAPTRVAFFVAAAIAAPLGEELFFRGWLQGLVSQRYRPFLSALIVAVPFSLLHLDPVGFLARVELGLIFGLARAWSRSLWPAVVLHATHNGLQLLIFFVTPDPLHELEQPFAWGPAALIAFLGLISTTQLLKKFKTLSSTPAEGVPSASEPSQSLAAPCLPIDETRSPFTLNLSTPLRSLSLTLLSIAACVALLLHWGRSLPGGNLLPERIQIEPAKELD